MKANLRVRQVLITSLLLVGLMSFSSVAYGQYGGGSGTKEDPYLIYDPNQMNSIGLHPEDWDKHFLLMADLDFSCFGESDYNIIGTGDTSFTGVFDGNHHEIRNFTWISVDISYIGLFDNVYDGYIKNLRLVDVYIDADNGSYVGSLVAFNEGRVYNCSATGTVKGRNCVGGLVGLNRYARITNCYSLGDIEGDTYVGGLTGSNEYAYIIDSYSGSNVTGVDYVGGLIGRQTNHYQVAYCYSYGRVIGESKTGGFIGSVSSNPIISSFWDIQTSGQTLGIGEGSNEGVEGKSTVELQQYSTYGDADWDFYNFADGPDDIWVMPNSGGYPLLWWQANPLPDLPFSEGSGTKEDPFLISSIQELQNIGQNPRLMESHFRLIDHVDYAEAEFQPIGSLFYMFQGDFDGNNYEIRNIYYSHESERYAGLFPYIANASISNVIITDPNIVVDSGWYVGSLVGNMESGDIDNCQVIGGNIKSNVRTGGLVGYARLGSISNCDVNIKLICGDSVGGLVGENSAILINCNANVYINGEDKVGGLVGENDGDIKNCHIKASNISGIYQVGGLVGFSDNGNIVFSSAVGIVNGQGNAVGGLVGRLSNRNPTSYCYADCDVSGDSSIGGLVGYFDNYSKLNHCYSLGNVSGIEKVGGLVGYVANGFIKNCYSTGYVNGTTSVGGLIGDLYSYQVENSFWDMETSGQVSSDGGTGKTTAEMLDPNTYLNAGWDFVGEYDNGPSEEWAMPMGGGYPILWWQLESLPPLPTFTSGSGDKEDPYLIADADELNHIGHNLQLMDAHFRLIQDVDMSGRQIFSIGSALFPFTGTFEGDNHSIQNISSNLFENINGKDAKITNVRIVNPNITDGQGSLANILYNGKVMNCQVEGGVSRVGGLVYENRGILYNCHASCDVSGSGLVSNNFGIIDKCSASGNVTSGGLIGSNYGTISQSFATGNVSGSTSSSSYSGGFVVQNYNNGIITDCYAQGSVTGRYAAGFVGYNYGGIISRCYSTGSSPSGFASRRGSPNISYSFWDIQASGADYSEGGFGKTTQQLRMAKTFVGWGNEPVWTINEGYDYPRLIWENKPGDIITTQTYSQGSGTVDDPFLIYTDSHLMGIGLNPADWDKHFKLMSDIDLSGYTGTDFTIIQSFSGVFDGNGHSIHNFSYASNGIDQIGLFKFSTGIIRNLNLIDVNIEATNGESVGSIVGYNNGGTIQNCYISGIISGTYRYIGGITGRNRGEVINCQTDVTVTGGDYIGGIAGTSHNGVIVSCICNGNISGLNSIGGISGHFFSSYNSDSGLISKCLNNANVTGNEKVGGLTGYISRSTIELSISTGNVSGIKSVGGAIGHQSGREITNCYATGNVSGDDSVGGLVGLGTNITDCYSIGHVTGNTNVGGLVGSVDPDEVFHSYWNTETSGQLSSAGGEGKTTAEMYMISTFAQWACEPIWTINEGLDYPRLYWESATGVPIESDIWFAGGSGTPEDPYLIETPEQLNKIGDVDCLLDKHFKLIADIDLSGYDGLEGRPLFNIIGYYEQWGIQKRFSGTFDGDGHIISNFTHTSDTRDCVGIFGYADGNDAEIKNIGLVNVNINAPNHNYVGALGARIGARIINCWCEGGSVKGGDKTGGLIGTCGTIENCHTNIYVQGNNYVGGLSGYGGDVKNCYALGNVLGGGAVGGLLGAARKVENSYATGKVTASDESAGGLIGSLTKVFSMYVKNCYANGEVTGTGKVGGLIGFVKDTGYRESINIIDSYALGSVTGSDDCVGGLVGQFEYGSIHNCFARGSVRNQHYSHFTGGLVGYAGYSGGEIRNCYAQGNVTGGYESGGLVGKNRFRIFYSYSKGRVTGNSTVGGMIGDNVDDSLIFLSYWDVHTSGRSTSDGGKGKSTSQMKNINTFVGWGCDEAWTINNGIDYPRLAVEQKPGVIIENPVYGGGSGDPNNPYLIYSRDQFNTIGLIICHWDKHFKLMTDINLAGISASNYNMIGFDYSHYFSGVFDGNGYTISNFNYVTSDSNYIGLFGLVNSEEAEIKNLGIINPRITANNGRYVGALVGYLTNGIIINCFVEGGTVTGNSNVGGLFGRVSRPSKILNCYSTCDVTGEEYIGGLVGANYASVQGCYSAGIITGINYVGGLLGCNGTSESGSSYGGEILYCYSTCNVSGSINIGGLIGYNRAVDYYNINNPVKYCYFSGTVEGTDYIGGLIGYNSSKVENCYSTGAVSGFEYVGGLVGLSSNTISNCYSLCDTNGNQYVGGLIGYSYGSISNSLATGIVNGNTETGGFVGYNNNASFNNCLWDITVNSSSNGIGNDSDPEVIGETTSNLQNDETYIRWSCEPVWKIDDGNDYPHLIWEDIIGELIEKPNYGGGSGTEEDPYLIYNVDQLNTIALLDSCDLDKHFKLMADLDLFQLNDIGFRIIGENPDYPFKGIFDGNGYIIYNFTYASDSKDNIGLFGNVNDSYARIINLGMVDPNVTAGNGDNVGAIAGSLENGLVSNCYVKYGYISGKNRVGGLVGYNIDGSIRKCYSNISITGEVNVGGLVGFLYNGNIYDSYSSGHVLGDDAVGGLIGGCYRARAYDCYSKSYVTGNTDTGGFIGVVQYSNWVRDCFWDIDTSGQATSVGGTGKTTSEMQQKETYTTAGWDFIVEEDNGTENIWRLCKEGMQYPDLTWKYAPSDFACPDGTDNIDLYYFIQHWLLEGSGLPCDIAPPPTGDDVVDFLDYAEFAKYWLEGKE